MTRPVVRCRCGHRVLAKEVLRTDLYERPSGREYVYVKYRCKRCKRLGETFVAESRWDWRIFEASRSELSEAETDSFAGQSPITEDDVLEFHKQLEAIDNATGLAVEKPSDEAPEEIPSDGTSPRARPEAPRPDAKRDFKSDVKADHKSRPSETGATDESSRGKGPQRDS